MKRARQKRQFHPRPLLELCLDAVVPRLIETGDRFALSAFPQQLLVRLFAHLKASGELQHDTIMLFLHSHLEAIDLAGYLNTSREFIVAIARMHMCLRSLDVSACNLIPEEAFPRLTSLCNLHSLSVASCRNFTSRPLLAICQLTQLRSLNISNNRLAPAVVNAALASMPLLQQLHVAELGLSDDDVPSMQTLSQLAVLDASGNRFQTCVGWNMLKELQVVNADYNPINTLYWLGGLTQLYSLDIEHIELPSAKQFIHLRNHTRLQHLKFPKLGMTQSDVSRFHRLEALQEMDISGCSQIYSLSFMSNMHQCYSLDATGAGLTSLRGLEACPLEELRLVGCRKLADESITAISGVASLTSLNLSNCRLISDQACRYLGHAVTLRELSLSRTSVTDMGMYHFSSLTRLAHLDISHTDVTPDGLTNIRSILPATAHVRTTRIVVEPEEEMG